MLFLLYVFMINTCKCNASLADVVYRVSYNMQAYLRAQKVSEVKASLKNSSALCCYL